jgi:hypothetical protein
VFNCRRFGDKIDKRKSNVWEWRELEVFFCSLSVLGYLSIGVKRKGVMILPSNSTTLF